MKRWFAIGVLSYMILGILWWGKLLYNKNDDLYNLQLEHATTEAAVANLQEERSRQNLMIIGEGVVLGLSLLAGIFIINRSASREVKTAKQQSNFLLSVSHELKSPIAAIKLALETLTRPNLPEKSVAMITTSAVKDADRLEKLVQNILLSASIEEDRLELYKEETNISLLLSKIRDRYARAARQGHEIITEGIDQPIIINIDTYNISQAITNILDNAVKYADKNTPISVKTYENKEEVTIEITNQGTPISTDEQELIFKKFFRSQDKKIRRKEGTGIGLYISNQILRAHGGFITTQNKGNNLVQFTIKLPK